MLTIGPAKLTEHRMSIATAEPAVIHRAHFFADSPARAQSRKSAIPVAKHEAILTNANWSMAAGS
jgi:hypothetical protein